MAKTKVMAKTKKTTTKTPGARMGIVKDKNFVQDQLIEQARIMATALGVETEQKLKKDLQAQILKKLTKTSLKAMCNDTKTNGIMFSKHLLENVLPKHAQHAESDESMKNKERIDVIVKSYF